MVYMDEDEVIEAASALSIDRLVPTHHGMWKGVGAGPAALSTHAASFEHPRVIEPIEVGDRFDVDRPGIVPPRVLEDPGAVPTAGRRPGEPLRSPAVSGGRSGGDSASAIPRRNRDRRRRAIPGPRERRSTAHDADAGAVRGFARGRP